MTKIVCVGAETPSGCMVVADTLLDTAIRSEERRV